MPKKALIYVLFLVLISWLQMEQQQNAAASDAGIQTIPEEAVRLRILAHNNSPEEQLVKTEVRDAVNQQLQDEMTSELNKEEALTKLQRSLPGLKETVQSILDDHGLEKRGFSIAVKSDVDFPTRIYGPIVYPAGEYEALVVTIGKGEGDNWWCVLFPPLCFISSGDSVDKSSNSVEKEDVSRENVEKSGDSVDEKEEYRFFVVEKWNSWFGDKG
ncbi:stage II sporulation protein R [Salibacterium halotolerans]|uniref:Stage II sporulation protein R n=1 Tax=Salibacterium halotolerans TaxID=1884432 RepID=A0A1I5V341_9BACI|nr:stage II sporulation protein R [Salibacterium halotolerans]SFQ01881.1 stage II sporulation protein R [Salibacterium halotolerans]